MKSILFIVLTSLSVMSSVSLAKSISVTAFTLDEAENKIMTKAAEQGLNYTITSARVGNHVHMTAKLSK